MSVKRVLWLGLILLLAACRGEGGGAEKEMLHVVATTTIVGDVVARIGGDAISLTVLLSPGADPHSFEPSPQDARALAGTDLIFANGLGLEEFLDPLIEGVATDAPVIEVSASITPRMLGDHPDPHVWFDPNLVLLWTQTIEETLKEYDPAHADLYAQNAEAYREELSDLDAWIRAEVARIPAERRRLVTDHRVFGYFADRYGFEVVGAVLPGFSSAAEPSAQDIAALEDVIRDLGVRAIFVGVNVNPVVAERVAEDTGVRVVRLYTGSLSEADGEVPHYLDLMRYDVSAIVGALAEGE